MLRVACNLIQILTQIGADVPKMSELHDHVMDAVASDWFHLGIVLDSQFDKLKIIRRDHHGDIKESCTAMLKHWLDVDKTASWDKLIAALESIQHNALAEKIKAMTSKGGVRRYIHSITYIITCMWLHVYGHVHKCCCTYTNACGMPFQSSK